MILDPFDHIFPSLRRRVVSSRPPMAPSWFLLPHNTWLLWEGMGRRGRRGRREEGRGRKEEGRKRKRGRRGEEGRVEEEWEEEEEECTLRINYRDLQSSGVIERGSLLLTVKMPHL